jgi:succinate dehydrogenase/fumarate reductase flavoprotein subunit
MVEVGEDFKFGRFSKQSPDRNAVPVSKAPFYAVRTRPMTRKNLGGPAINPKAQALNTKGRPVAGLYAAGELTGVAGINGRYGGAGTFLGPSVYTGRIAGAAAAKASQPAMSYRKLSAVEYSNAPHPGAEGYWHFDVAHKLVSERGYSCTKCHSDTNPMQPASERAVLLARLDTCILCH